MNTDPSSLGRQAPTAGVWTTECPQDTRDSSVWVDFQRGAPIYQVHPNLPGMSQIPPGFDKVTDYSDKLICVKVLMADNRLSGYSPDNIYHPWGQVASESGGLRASCLSASLSLPAHSACSLLSVFSAMHWQFPLQCLYMTLSNSSIKDQLKISSNKCCLLSFYLFSKSCSGTRALASPRKW